MAPVRHDQRTGSEAFYGMQDHGQVGPVLLGVRGGCSQQIDTTLTHHRNEAAIPYYNSRRSNEAPTAPHETIVEVTGLWQTLFA